MLLLEGFEAVDAIVEEAGRAVLLEKQSETSVSRPWSSSLPATKMRPVVDAMDIDLGLLRSSVTDLRAVMLEGLPKSSSEATLMLQSGGSEVGRESKARSPSRSAITAAVVVTATARAISREVV